MTNQPAGHRVIVRPDACEEVTPSGIVIPKTTAERETRGTTSGTLVRIGENAWRAFDDGKPWAKVGDRVHFRRYAGFEIKEGDQLLLVMQDEDILTFSRQEGSDAGNGTENSN